MTDVVIIHEPDVVMVEAGLQGPPGRDGATGAGTAKQLNFAWGDATPAIIVTAMAGKTVYRVELFIIELFNGIGATVTVGDGENPNRLLAIDDANPAATGSYETSPGHRYATATDINLYITPGSGASSGRGFILVYIEE